MKYKYEENTHSAGDFTAHLLIVWRIRVQQGVVVDAVRDLNSEVITDGI